jgi:hypothetical protein
MSFAFRCQISRSRRKPQLHDLLPTIKSLLRSSRPVDVISEELLEIIGFEDVELVTDIMQHQNKVAELVRACILTVIWISRFTFQNQLLQTTQRQNLSDIARQCILTLYSGWLMSSQLEKILTHNLRIHLLTLGSVWKRPYVRMLRDHSSLESRFVSYRPDSFNKSIFCVCTGASTGGAPACIFLFGCPERLLIAIRHEVQSQH